MSKLSRVRKIVKPDPPIKEPEYKSTGSWGKYKHREVGPEVMRIKRAYPKSWYKRYKWKQTKKDKG
jgi:hypothetical protein